MFLYFNILYSHMNSFYSLCSFNVKNFRLVEMLVSQIKGIQSHLFFFLFFFFGALIVLEL